MGSLVMHMAHSMEWNLAGSRCEDQSILARRQLVEQHIVHVVHALSR